VEGGDGKGFVSALPALLMTRRFSCFMVYSIAVIVSLLFSMIFYSRLIFSSRLASSVLLLLVLLLLVNEELNEELKEGSFSLDYGWSSKIGCWGLVWFRLVLLFC